MILFVDAEHETGYSQPWAEFLLANRTRIAYDLEDISGDVCLLQRYTRVDMNLLDRYDIRAVFISGASTDPDQYSAEDLAGLRQIVRGADIPMFGFCGGFQFMAEALGRPIERIGPLVDGDEDPDPEFMPGWKTESGYLPVELVGDHPVLEGLGADTIFRQYHGWEIKELPDGFVNYARSDTTEIQLAINEDRRLLGTQFHPEYFTDDHPAGRTLIHNFCVWSGLLTG